MKSILNALVSVAAVIFATVGGLFVLAVAALTGGLRALDKGIEPRQRR